MEYREYTADDIIQVAKSACDAAIEKCRELGIDPVDGSIEGLERATESSLRAALICALVPNNLLKELIDAHGKSQVDELIDEAEGILGGE